MKILICNERFLFRFGADRTLIMLGRGLRELGHEIAIMANRYDRAVVEKFASRVIDVPADQGPYLALNEFTANWIGQNWKKLFPDGGPDVAIIGGWPFLSAIPILEESGCRVVFVDFGVVPADGYPEGTAVTLNKLRALRHQYLKDASLVIGISRFITDSQSRPDTQDSVPVRTILLGADHLEMDIWPNEVSGDAENSALTKVRAIRKQGGKTVLCLGRWEPGCYKNSEAALDVIRSVAAKIPDAYLLVLDRASAVSVPEDLREKVVPLGFPSDEELNGIMREVDLAISPSLWEGFNLPLAEMQWFDRPVLVLSVGAHPEVAAHEWFLCRDTAEMARKATDVLEGGGLKAADRHKALVEFRRRFTWANYIHEFNDAITEMLTRRISRMTLVIDVSNSVRDPANSGVIRVTRRVCRTLQDIAEPIFAVWQADLGRYGLPTALELGQLGQFNGPAAPRAIPCSPSSTQRIPLENALATHSGPKWLLLSETIAADELRRIISFARTTGLHIGAIFYDAIPVLKPELCNAEMQSNHAGYMKELANADVVMPISHFSADSLTSMWASLGQHVNAHVAADVLPGEFGGVQRNELPKEAQAGDAVRILCVSTLEPRKNHKRLIEACLLMKQNHPDLRWQLILVGNRYAGAFEIADYVSEISLLHPEIQWLGIVDDAVLEREYRDADFSVYPSVMEGFGMPIMESIWHGRPCLCANEGVMSELAAGGGCLTTGVLDVHRLSEDIYKLCTDLHLRRQLSHAALHRPIKTWKDYAAELITSLQKHSVQREPQQVNMAGSMVEKSRSWDQVLYADCLGENWQMHDSERLALTAILARHRPEICIEVGTYQGGSLSLISQYARTVFSIDIDPSIPEKFSHFKNVSFLTGPSSFILPALLSEMDRVQIGPDFILIDGDHSRGGVKTDIESVLRYRPIRPFFLVMHDSVNPGCRAGMMEAPWRESRFCQWVDLDFVPGRLVEHQGPSHGEMWGGLAAAYFTPEPRTQDLTVRCSAALLVAALQATMPAQSKIAASA